MADGMPSAITYGSVCSGIEAVTVAVEPMGWKAAWFAEIEAFPSAVLAHHYPDVPNLGDMTVLPARVLAGDVAAPEVLVGGTPCQAFSVAGARQSLADERGNLTLRYVELANAIDHVRQRYGKPACIIWWENVPGVLSTKDNAFGCFLAGLAGEDEPLVPPGKKWANAGAVYGPKRAIAWRTLDAQYFGLAQRRRRVFVIASAREGFDPAQVLFEWDGVRRDSPPRREKGQSPAASLAASAGHHGYSSPRGDGSDNLIASTLLGGARRSDGYSHDDAPLVAASLVGAMKADHIGRETHLVAGTLQASGKAAGSATQQDAEAGLLVADTLRSHPRAGSNSLGAIAIDVPDVALCLNAGGKGRIDSESETMLACAFDTTQITNPDNRSNPQPGDPCHLLTATGHAPAIAFDSRQDPCSSTEVFGSLSSSSPQAQAIGFQSSQSGVRCNDVRATLDANNGSRRHNGVVTSMAVRRLTPIECERLQGFPDGYTDVPYRGKSAADGPRYKSLGNSMATKVIRWIAIRLGRSIMEKA